MTITEASKFLVSLRGRLILGQALALAIAELEKSPSPYRQESNIADMKELINSGLALVCHQESEDPR